MKPGLMRTFLLIAVPAALVMVALVFGGMELRRFLTTSPQFAVRKVEVLTKAAADNEELVRLAGIEPAVAVDLEILDEEGHMAHEETLFNLAKRFKLKIISIDELVEYVSNAKKKQGALN